MPIFLQGMGGPGAPHVFRLERRDMLGHLVDLMVLTLNFEKMVVELVYYGVVSLKGWLGRQQKSNRRNI